MSEYIVKCNKVVGISGKTLIVPDYIDTSKEIVRCRDCKFYSQEQPTEISGIFKVKHPAWCHKHIAETKPYGFCAWGKWKEGGDD